LIIFPRNLIFILVAWMSASAISGMAVAASSPDIPHEFVLERNVVLEKGQEQPQWKILWDEARQAAVAGRFDEALSRYQALLVLKNNLEEARWELARLRIHLRQWAEAATLLEILLEADSERTDYLGGLAQVLREKGQYERAVELFGRALAKKPADQGFLTGLVESLLKLGRKTEALPLVEQLCRLAPANADFQRQFALLAFDAGDYETALPYLVRLAEQKNADQEILIRTAQVHARLGLAAAAAYWQRVVVREPENAEANGWLGDYYEKKGQADRALPHLLALLGRESGNTSLLARIGTLYVKDGQHRKAVGYFEQHLQHHPDDREILRLLVKSYVTLGDREKALGILERYFVGNPVSDPEYLEMAARLFDEAGYFQKAIPLYRRLLAVSPNDQEILAALVTDLQAIGDNNGALEVWRRLAKVASNRASVYRAIAVFLEKIGRDDELLEILEQLHDLEPADEQISLQLASLYLKRAAYEEAGALYALLRKNGHRSVQFFEGAGQLNEKLLHDEQALRDNEELLVLAPARHDIRLVCARLAGKLGFIGAAFEHLANLATVRQLADDPELRIVRAGVLKEGGFYKAALSDYRWLASASMGQEMRRQAWTGEAALFQDAGLGYEAEEALRRAMTTDTENREYYIRQLVELALQHGQSEAAESWLQAMQIPEDSTAVVAAGADCSLHLARARFYAGKGDLRRAVRISRDLFNDSCGASEATAGGGPQDVMRLRVGLDFSKYLLSAGQIDEAENIANALRVDFGDRVELLVLLEQIYRRHGQAAKADDMARRNLAAAEEEFGQLLNLIGCYKEYGDLSAMARVAQVMAKREPEDLKTRFILAEIQERQGEFADAISTLQGIASEYSENSRATAEIARLFVRTGKFTDALQYCDRILEEQPGRPDVILLKARALWGDHQWKEATEVYKAYLATAVDEVLLTEAKQQNVALHLEPQTTFWNRITFTSGRIPRVSEVVMTPAHLLDTSQEKGQINRLAAPLYATYRWQDIFARELAARDAVQRREYYHAAKLYGALARDYGFEESLLFDLAGINSRLGNLGEETVLYQQLRAVNPEYPGLEEAFQRNRLKRQPLLSMEYGRRKEEGWGKYLAMDKSWQELAAWFSPRSEQELRISTTRTNYESPDDFQKLWSNRIFMSYEAKIFKGISLQLGGGVEDLDDGYPSSGIFSWALLGKLNDQVETFVDFRRENIDDTIASLIRGIVRQDTTTGVSIDLLPDLMVGGEYIFRDYSDDNQTLGYTLKSSYTVFPEPLYLRLGYNYQFLDARQGSASGGPLLADGFAAADHPYWNPSNYWQSRFSIYFKHQFAHDMFERGIPRYYTVEYGLGHDSRGHDLQDLRGSFFVEWTKHVIVKASAEIFHLKDARTNEITCSMIYRW